MSLVFENDAKVKVQLIKLDDSDRPLSGAVFNILKDGQLVGTEATDASARSPSPMSRRVWKTRRKLPQVTLKW